VNIVPSTTGAAIAVTRAIPSLRNRFDGISMRVPVVAGSLSAIVVLTERPTTVDEVNGVLQTAAGDSRWSKVMATTHDPLVSSDIIGDPHGPSSTSH
jgi:glyceraldehyde 3-phosphate dehydrogenase